MDNLWVFVMYYLWWFQGQYLQYRVAMQYCLTMLNPLVLPFNALSLCIEKG
jgi:hypothetical protein